MADAAISEEFAKRLLRALYALDDPINKLSDSLSRLSPGPQRDELKDTIAELLRIITSDLMVSIYHEQPQLGRASEPGPWLDEQR